MVDVRLNLKVNDVNGKEYKNVELVFVDETGKVLFKTQIRPSFDLSVKQYGLYNHCINEYLKDLEK